MITITWNDARIDVLAGDGFTGLELPDDWMDSVTVRVWDPGGSRDYPSLARAVSNDAALVLRPSTVIDVGAGCEELHLESYLLELLDSALVADPDAWLGARDNELDGSWAISAFGHRTRVPLTRVTMAGEPSAPFRAGTLVELHSGTFSMSTGDIAETYVIDSAGCLWLHDSGWDTVFHGRYEGEDLLELVLQLAPCSPYDDLAMISSDLLDEEQLRTVVRKYLESDEGGLSGDLEVRGDGFELDVRDVLAPEQNASDAGPDSGSAD